MLLAGASCGSLTNLGPTRLQRASHSNAHKTAIFQKRQFHALTAANDVKAKAQDSFGMTAEEQSLPSDAEVVSVDKPLLLPSADSRYEVRACLSSPCIMICSRHKTHSVHHISLHRRSLLHRLAMGNPNSHACPTTRTSGPICGIPSFRCPCLNCARFLLQSCRA